MVKVADCLLKDSGRFARQLHGRNYLAGWDYLTFSGQLF